MTYKEAEYIKMKMREELSNTYFVDNSEEKEIGYKAAIEDLEEILKSMLIEQNENFKRGVYEC